MKIKLALLENDTAYLNRVVPIFNNKFANELEIYSYTDVDAAINCLAEKKIDVFLASDSSKIDFSAIPKKCGFAYLVENFDIDKIDNHKTVCKFQKAEIIYKQILSIYSEHVPNITGITASENGAMKTIAFTSPVGGVGTSTSAAACAIAITNLGYRVLYLNAQVYGNADTFFSCDGQFDFSDVIYAIKSNKTNRIMKLQSTVKQDVSGVFYYSSVRVSLDMMEMKTSDYTNLQNELRMQGQYDYVIVDLDFPKTQSEFEFLQQCNSIVIVSDCSEIAKIKVDKFLKTVQILDGQNEFSIQPRMHLLKNKTSSNDLDQNEVKVLGSFPMYQQVSPAQMARQLSLSNIYEQLV